MAKIDKYSIKDLKREFPTDEACLEFIFNGLHTKKCSCGGEYHILKKRRQFQCSKCRFQIAPMAGTIFEKSTSPLTSWFHALFVFSNAKSGVSAKEMERQLGCTYKTAWRILNLIRSTLKQSRVKLQGGDIEMDEMYYGGKGDGGKYNKNFSKVMKAKTVVVGAVKRGGDLKAKVAKNSTAYSIGKFLKGNINPKHTYLITDESNRYEKIAVGYLRFSVNHSKKEYVRDNVHTNTIEGFWSHFKKSVSGTHKVISKKYLQSYLDGFVFHYNQRNDRARFSALLASLL